MQIKATLRYHFTPSRLARIRKTITSVGEDAGKLKPSCIAADNAKWCSHFVKQSGSFLKKFKHKLPYDPEFPLSGIYPREMKTYVHTQRYINVHSGISIIVSNWKPSKCPAAGEWLSKTRSIQTME